MRHLILAMLALFLIAPALSATEDEPADAVVSTVVSPVEAVVEPNADSGLQLTKVSVEERAVTSDDSMAAQLGPRGGFWWVVGVIVVAGVILAVIL